MTEETAGVPRLDYSKPPSRYSEPVLIGEEWHVVGPFWAENFGTEALATKAAWTHYKAKHDPPGTSTVDDAMFGWCFVIETRHYSWPRECSRPLREHHEAGPSGASARAAAWAWYDRRLALANILDDDGAAYLLDGCPEVWPRILAWSNEQVSKVERSLQNADAKMPEVMRG